MSGRRRSATSGSARTSATARQRCGGGRRVRAPRRSRSSRSRRSARRIRSATRPARFLNAAVAMETDLGPRELLDRLLAIERELGRTRDGPRYGPRTIDLDLLVYGDEVVDEPGCAYPIPACTSGDSCWSRSPSWTRTSSSPAWHRFGPARRARMTADVPPGRARRVRSRARASAQEGIHRRLRPVPLLRAHAGRDLPVQQARPQLRAAGELPVLPPEDGGRLGLGQEPVRHGSSRAPRSTPRAT